MRRVLIVEERRRSQRGGGRDRLPHDPVSDEPDKVDWSYVDVRLFELYFKVVYVLLDEPEECSIWRTILIDGPETLLGVVNSDEVLIRSVQIISPWHMNGTEAWGIHVLKAIYRSVEHRTDSSEQVAWVYETTNGERLLQSSLAETENDLLSVQEMARFAVLGG